MNKIMLMGRLTKDIEVNTTGKTSYCKFTLAVNRKFKKEGQADVDFINCTAFGNTAEVMGKYLGKGRQIAVTGRIQTGSYEKDGQKVYTTDVMLEEFHFADSKKANNNTSNETYTPVEEDDSLPF